MKEIEKAIEVLEACYKHPSANDAIAGLRAMLVQPAQRWKCGDADPTFQVGCDVPQCGEKEVLPSHAAHDALHFSQFLTDVMTAAGLVTHGKQCKALGARIGEKAMKYRGVTPLVKPMLSNSAQREPLTREQARNLMSEAGYNFKDTTPREQAAFLNGLRHAEIAHGITKG